MWIVLISDHIIIIHHLDVMLHIYNTLEKIQVALEANWESTSVMMKFDLNPPLVDQWSHKSTQTVTNFCVDVVEVTWGHNNTLACVGEEK